jgi:uncharacterized protein YndB with AHSA1/START domain
VNDTSDRALSLSRTFAAPRDLVFEAWTRAEHLDRWMGPDGFVTTTSSMDFRVGGEWIYEMRSEQYGSFPNRVRYTAIVPDERLEYDHDSGEGSTNGFTVVVTFADVPGGTLVTLTNTMATAEAAEAARKFGAVEMGGQTLRHLGEFVDSCAEADLVIVRELAAPVSRVWQAWTSAEALGAWWGPKGLGLRVERFDFRVGGLFHYAMLPPGDAPPMYGRFHFREIVPETRLSWINSFADEHGEIIRAPIAPEFPLEIFNTVSFTPTAGGTQLTLRGRPIRASEADKAFFAGMHPSMQGGFGGTFDQLVDWLAGNR